VNKLCINMVFVIIFMFILDSNAQNELKFMTAGQQYGVADLDHFWLATSPNDADIFFNAACENPTGSSVGSKINRTHANDGYVWGQFGCEAIPDYLIKAGEVWYTDNGIPAYGPLYIKIQYSKNTPATVPIEIFIQEDKKTEFTPANTGNWDTFTSTDWLELIPQEECPQDMLEPLLQNSIKVFSMLRNTPGAFSDKIEFSNGPINVCSIASIGMGLISLCIADQLGYINNAEAMVLETLEAMSGLKTEQGFDPARNVNNGIFRHFINMNNGSRAWDSEYSSIDTGILVTGALFCAKYFAGNETINHLANCLYTNVDWNSCIANPANGDIYMTFTEDGQGQEITKPFNEYMIVAWLAKNAIRNNERAVTSWNNSYGVISRLPKSTFGPYSLLTDNPGSFLSDFTIQFAYYLCHYFRTNQSYLNYLNNAMQADKLWWRNNTDAPDYVWGLGAGEDPGGGYSPNSINNNPNNICSPHIIAGFIPLDKNCYCDLVQLWDAPLGRYELPDQVKTNVLWRFSYASPTLKAPYIQGLDYSTMVFGLASHPDLLGIDFFDNYTNFDFIDNIQKTNSQIPDKTELMQNYPNPFNPNTTIPFCIDKNETVQLSIYNIKGQLVKTLFNSFLTVGYYEIPWDGRDESGNKLPSGVYFYKLKINNTIMQKKLILVN